MSWGHATSLDLLKWTRKRDPVLRPDQSYDADGVFTGCFAPSTDTDDRQLTIVYSSIRKLPFHWSTPPYPRNAAGLALAMSYDAGKTWDKSRDNPILCGEPDGVEVTGFRDPYIAKWPSIDRLLGHAEEKVYGLVSGGIETSGPTTFLYEIQPSDLRRWKYLGPLIALPLSFQPSKKWSGNFGINWECVNFLSLQSDSALKHFLIIGAEGAVERDHIKNYRLPACLPPRTVRTQVWMAGDLVNEEGSISLEYRQGGYLDHGSYYAANSFQDPRSGRRILHGWIPEEDITLEHAKCKGWNGSLAIPREVFLLTIPAVVNALRSPLSDMTCVSREFRADGSYDLHTLGVRPISEASQYRDARSKVHETDRQVVILPRPSSEQQRYICSTMSTAWELEATVSLRPECETVGFHIRHNRDLSISTTITFSALDESIKVDRHSSNDDEDINKCVESGPFTLFTAKRIAGVASQEVELKQEELHIRIISDGDVLEVFANDRFALATMVYSNCQSVKHGGITAFATGETASAVFESISVWDGLNGAKSIVIEEIVD